jgi:hypothetical protein
VRHDPFEVPHLEVRIDGGVLLRLGILDVLLVLLVVGTELLL